LGPLGTRTGVDLRFESDLLLPRVTELPAAQLLNLTFSRSSALRISRPSSAFAADVETPDIEACRDLLV